MKRWRRTLALYALIELVAYRADLPFAAANIVLPPSPSETDAVPKRTLKQHNAALRLSAHDIPDGQNYLQWYGNWCGGNHGGFQDCCGGSRCPQCVIKRGAVPATLITKECLEECPPVDDLDAVCAWHDACTFSFDRPLNFSCRPQGNHCFCDCNIVKKASAVVCPSYACTAFRASLEELFLHGTACYHKGNGSDLVCEGVGFGGRLMNYCNGTLPDTKP